MSNNSILEQNTLAGFSETSGILYLKLIETTQSEKKAFLLADTYERLTGNKLDKILREFPGFSGMPAEVRTALSKFFSERYRNNFI